MWPADCFEFLRKIWSKLMIIGLNTLNFFTVSLLSLILASCGVRTRDSNILQDQTQRQEGAFIAQLEPITPESGQGVANFNVDRTTFTAKVTMENLSSEIIHRQYIHTGINCPTTADNLGQALEVTGLILIPLDNDLSEQEARGQYPQAETDGSYYYFNFASLEDMIIDLRRPETTLRNQNFTKLTPDVVGLNMEGRTVMVTEIRGNEEIPIACGVITRSTE
jgi:hypothetical protein